MAERADRASFGALFALIAAAASDSELEDLIDDIKALEDGQFVHDLAHFWQRRWFEVTDRPLAEVAAHWKAHV
jgi:hypothetical protein